MSESGKFSAQDIRHQEFSSKLRGYDKEEVDQFLTVIADNLEKEAALRADLENRLKLMEGQMAEFKNLEGTLKNTLLRTQETADDVKRSAERESELIIREAQVKADRMIDEKQVMIRQLDEKFEGLKSKWDEYFVRFRNLLTSHLENLEKMQSEYRELVQGTKNPLA